MPSLAYNLGYLNYRKTDMNVTKVCSQQTALKRSSDLIWQMGLYTSTTLKAHIFKIECYNPMHSLAVGVGVDKK